MPTAASDPISYHVPVLSAAVRAWAEGSARAAELGPVLGGVIIGLLENFAHFLDSEYLHWGNLYEIAPFYALIIILMIKPYGLFGTKDIERV